MKIENKRKKNMDEWKMAWQLYKQKQMEEEAVHQESQESWFGATLISILALRLLFFHKKGCLCSWRNKDSCF